MTMLPIDPADLALRSADDIRAVHSRLMVPAAAILLAEANEAKRQADLVVEVTSKFREAPVRRAPLILRASSEVRRILIEVADKHKVAVEDILGPRRTARVVWGRHEAMYRVACERANLSLPQIGRIFGRDHTTVLHGVRKHAFVNDLPYPQRSVGLPGRRP